MVGALQWHKILILVEPRQSLKVVSKNEKEKITKPKPKTLPPIMPLGPSNLLLSYLTVPNTAGHHVYTFDVARSFVMPTFIYLFFLVLKKFVENKLQKQYRY